MNDILSLENALRYYAGLCNAKHKRDKDLERDCFTLDAKIQQFQKSFNCHIEYDVNLDTVKIDRVTIERYGKLIKEIKIN